MSNPTKKTQGRKKIAIKKIEDVNSRQVTFSKRRQGLFNKASELCVLTGAEVAILVESPGGRVFAFGHPDVQTVVNRYIGDLNDGTPKLNLNADGVRSGRNAVTTSEFNMRCVEMSKELEAQKQKQAAIDESAKDDSFWWERTDISKLNDEQLAEYINAIEKLKHNINTRIKEVEIIEKNNAMNMMPNNNVVDDVFNNVNGDDNVYHH